LNGIRHFMREFTAMSVNEHLRDQVETTGGSPKLTKREVELVRFVLERPGGWGPELQAPPSTEGEMT